MATAGALFLAGDFLCQYIERYRAAEDKKALWRFDFGRALRMTTFGVFVLGPVGHYWYGFLDGKFPATSTAVVAKKVFYDEFCMGPPYLLSFFLVMCGLEGRNWAYTREKIKSDFWPVYKADVTVWVPAAAINFWLIPPMYRVLYVSTVSVFWNAYLSAVQHHDSHSERAADSSGAHAKAQLQLTNAVSSNAKK